MSFYYQTPQVSEGSRVQYANGGRQFPGRFPALPDIANAEPQPQRQPPQFSDLEARLGATEATGRSMVEGLVRLQSELLAVSRQGEEALREERRARQALEAGLRTSAELVGALDRRLREQEARLREERQALGSLALSARLPADEPLATAGLSTAAGVRVSALERDVEAMSRARLQLERIASQLAEEMAALKRRLEAQGIDLSGAAADLKANTRRLEEACGSRLETVQRRIERTGDSEQQGRVLRALVDSGLAGARDELVQLRAKADSDAEERRAVEQRAAARLSQLQAALAEAARKLADSLIAVEARRRERERQLDADRAALAGHLRDRLAEAIQAAAEREARLREEAARLTAETERSVLAQQETRLGQERAARMEMDRRWEAARHQDAEQLAELRTATKSDRAAAAELLRRLDEALAALDRRLADARRELGRSLAEEVTSRQEKDKETSRHLAAIEDKIAAATTALHQAVAGVAAQARAEAEAERRRAQQMIDKLRQENARRLVDTETQIGSLRHRLLELDDRVEAKLAAAANAMSQSVREKMEEIAAWQAQANSQISELRQAQKSLDDETKATAERIDESTEDSRVAVGSEVFGRVADIDRLRAEIQSLADSLSEKEDGVTRQEMEECQASIRRLAEISQAVKSVLSNKVLAEQQQRAATVQAAREELERLRELVASVAERLLEPAVFVKPENWRVAGREAAETKAYPVNRWSLYAAVRWSRIRKHWMHLKYLAMSRRDNRAADG